jgi:hypothetical protein
MANSNRTKIKPQGLVNRFRNKPSGEDAVDDKPQEYQRPSPLNGVALPRPQKANRSAEKHAFHTLKRTVLRLGKRAIDGRSGVAKALKRWRRDVAEDLGGRDNMSTAQLEIINLASKQKFLLDSIDAWLLLQDTLITGKKKSPALIPVVKERQAVANALVDYLAKLGLERRHKVQTLHEILAEKESE